jgi:hypothetical protein
LLSTLPAPLLPPSPPPLGNAFLILPYQCHHVYQHHLHQHSPFTRP